MKVFVHLFLILYLLPALPAMADDSPAKQLDALSAEFTEAFWTERDYDKAFYISFRLEEMLAEVDEQEYPDRRKTYFKLGEAYYLFLDFRKSIELLEKALSPVPLSFDDTANLDALKILGICYANIGKMDESDRYFRSTLESKDEVRGRSLYNAYAVSHLGCNEMLKGNYNHALELSARVWPILRKTDDYGHLAGMCFCRGQSYLHKGDYKSASQWADSLVFFAHKDQYNQSKRIKQAYQLQADYYTMTGDARKAKVFNDSLVGVYRNDEQAYTSQYIARALKRYDNERLAVQSARLDASYMHIAVLSLVSLISIVVIFIIASLYRKKNMAYKALAQKAEEWAREDKASEAILNLNHETAAKSRKEPAMEEDKQIMLMVEEEMAARFTYREASLSVESLADLLRVHRNSLSRAINKVAGVNFNQYINGWRIKEAVRLISALDHKSLYIEELYERVGFSNRTSFYRTFKNFTGLSPIEFQRQKRGSANKE